jgi:LytR cell envelope-related transcriptional attenuator
MNERVPDSSGLPLRAMVMVLLFLGVIFLLVGFQAIGSGDDGSDDSTSTPTVSASASPTAEDKPADEPAPPRADVRVYNISEVAGAADRTATRLREADWNVTETGNLTLPDVTATTVYFGSDEERASAEEVAKVLDARVEPRIPDPQVLDQPPGVIVVVTG